LRWLEGAYMLQDLGSTNGTRVNGEALQGESARQPSELLELQDGDRVVFANLEFQFELADGSEE
jgi:pSer/pThr/pTyr-binding forkhead associated (FHA) protein